MTSVPSFASHIRSCTTPKQVSHIHKIISSSSHCNNTFLGNLLIQMYGKCRSIEDADTTFQNLVRKNTVSWNLMIKAYVENGEDQEAVHLLKKMDLEGIEIDIIGIVTLIPACAILKHATALHSRISASGLDKHVVVGTALVKLYGRLGELEKSKMVFDCMPEKNVISWTTMLAAYAQNGHMQLAREFFDCMPEKTIVSWSLLLSGYAESEGIIHALDTFETMPERDVVSWTIMLTAYAHEGDVYETKSLFDRMPERTLVSWNAMLGAYAQQGHVDEAKSLFDSMPKRDNLSWNSLLLAYAHHNHLHHMNEFFKTIPELTTESYNTVVSAYIRHGELEKARGLFNTMVEKDSVSWGTILNGYARNGCVEDTRDLLVQMQECNANTVRVVITGYVRSGHYKQGIKLFRELNLEGFKKLESSLGILLETCTVREAEELLKAGFHPGDTALFVLFTRSGRLRDAERLFGQIKQRDRVVWNMMASVYLRNSCFEQARDVLMRAPDRDVVTWTLLLSTYIEDGDVRNAEHVFHAMPHKNTVSWNTMLVAYVRNGDARTAFQVVQTMDIEGVNPDNVSIVAGLDACSEVPDLTKGKLLHEEVYARNLSGLVIGNALVNLYGKCGNIVRAGEVFQEMVEKDVVTWTTMITVYSRSGYHGEALDLFKEMALDGINPNGVTALNVLVACGHAGLTEECFKCFVSLKQDYGVVHTVEHFVCMIDSLGRCGMQLEAEELSKNMPFKVNSAAWTALAAYTSLPRVLPYLSKLDQCECNSLSPAH